MHLLVIRAMTLPLLTTMLRAGGVQSVRLAAFSMRNAIVVLVVLPLLIAALFVSARDTGEQDTGERDGGARDDAGGGS